jgi:nucleosome binding factor SPN SPT16 subunit
VKFIQNIGVKIGVNARDFFRIFSSAVNFIADIVIVQRRLQYEWGWGLNNMFSSLSSDNQQFIDSLSGHVITNGHAGVNQQVTLP